MPAMASVAPDGVADTTTPTPTATSAAATRALETRDVLADSRNDEPIAVQRSNDREHVHREHACPEEHEWNDREAPGPERDHDEQLHDDRQGQEHREFSGHEHEAMLRVPLDFGVVSGEEKGDDREGPHVGQHEHCRAVRRAFGHSRECTISFSERAKADTI